jgi:hypothetical protein
MTSAAASWAVFGVFAILIVVALGLWIRFLPKYRQYQKKEKALSLINQKYVELCRRRRDLVYHFFWSVDRGDSREADMHEGEILVIDKELSSLKSQYDDVAASS